MNNSENNSDFYKLKYLKYKNKYISLKNKNELELKGGVSPVEGRFLFYIPDQVLEANNITFNEQNIPSRHLLSFDHLCRMSVLVIPVDPDKKISSTKEWFIPPTSTGFFEKFEKFKPNKWGEEKIYNIHQNTINTERKWLYYIAKEYLDENSKYVNHENSKYVNLNEQNVSCLEYEILKYRENIYITRTTCESFESYKKTAQLVQIIINNFGGEKFDKDKHYNAYLALIEEIKNNDKMNDEEKKAAMKKEQEQRGYTMTLIPKNLHIINPNMNVLGWLLQN